jgi:CRISPR-associated endonuclease Cas1
MAYGLEVRMQEHDIPPKLDGRRSVAREPHTCLQCGASFIPKRQTRGMFCSRACYGAWWRETRQPELSKQGNATLDRLHDEGRDPRANDQTTWKRRMAFRHSALTMAPEDGEGDDELWAERAGYWSEQADPEVAEPTVYRRQERRPLVLAGHGLRLRIHRGTLFVTHGFTHYPQKAREQRFFPGDPKLPSRIILLSTNGSISLDVARWLSEQNVPLVLIDYRGQVVSVLGTETTAADLELRRAQIEALSNGCGLTLSCALIEQKLTASLETLATLPPSVAQESAIDRVASLLHRLRTDPPQTIDELRLLEAWAAISYFAAWRTIRLRWKGTGKRPIPPEWRQVGMRQDVLRRSNRHARHPVNAMLNYGYAILESQIRLAIAEVGLDPTIGYLHVCQPGRQALVYDLMEPYRPAVDRAVIDIVRTGTWVPADFVVNSKSVCRLSPDLARAVCARCLRGASPDAAIGFFAQALLGHVVSSGLPSGSHVYFVEA